MTRPFVEEHPEMQHLFRELAILRQYNKQDGLGDNKLLLFAEGALAVIALERLLRILPAVKAGPHDRLHQLLRKAHDGGVIEIVSANLQEAIKKLTRVRDTTLHANYEEAAAQAGCDVRTYFRTQYTPEIDHMGGLFLTLLNVVDHRDGTVASPVTITVDLP